jgi:hypothetical protein
MKAGDIMIIPPNVPHEFIFLEDTIDIDGIRFLNECKSLGIQVVNCSPYIRE